VNPLDRRPKIPTEDISEISALISDPNNTIIGQNIKFDIAALNAAKIYDGDNWPWDRTFDTLIAGHLLASNQPHDLTSMGIQYLGINIEKYEVALHEITEKARRFCRSKLPTWRIASSDLPELPSAKGECWRNDYWLPRAVARQMKYPRVHPWWTVLEEYANKDSEVTVMLWQAQEKRIKARKLWKIFEERMKLLPIAYGMENRGVTLSKCRLDELTNEYTVEIERSGRVLQNIAATYKGPCPTCVGFPKRGSKAKLKKTNSKPKKRRAAKTTVDILVTAQPLQFQPNMFDLSPVPNCTTCNNEKLQPFHLPIPKGGSNDALKLLAFSDWGLNLLGKGLSREQLIEHLGSDGKLRIKLGKSGEPSLDKEIVGHYIATLPHNSRALAFLKLLAARRKRVKDLSAMESYRRFWHELDELDGMYLIHPFLNPVGTDTLRWSSSSPNSQNFSKQGMFEGDKHSIRYILGPAPGREWWSLDAQNIELRIPAYKSGEAEVIELFERPKDPPYYGSNHLLNFSTVYPEIWEKELQEVGFEKVGPHCKKKYASTWYQWCKNGGFSMLYGAGKAKADRTFHKEGAYGQLNERFAKMNKLNEDTIAFANKYGYVEIFPDKSVDPDRGYPILCTRTEYGKILSTVPLSYKVQGTAMYWTGKAMIRVEECFRDWRKNKFNAWIALQVHDEIVVDLPLVGDPIKNPTTSNLTRVREIQRLMSLSGEDIGVPTPVGCEYHLENWSEGITV
jgi:DNA polymerase I-like protein with 3'-5' exonuclease and polymerase domains